MGLFKEVFYNSQGNDTILFKHLTDYREKVIVAEHLSFYMDFFSDYYMDKTVTDKYGNPKKVNLRK